MLESEYDKKSLLLLLGCGMLSRSSLGVVGTSDTIGGLEGGSGAKFVVCRRYDCGNGPTSSASNPRWQRDG